MEKEKGRVTDKRWALRLWVKELTQGILIGAGGILPGISGAALAVVFGVYEEITALLAYPKTHILPFIRRRWLLVLGIVSGFLVFTLLLDQLFTRYSFAILFIFSGFIAGTLPGIFMEAKKKGIGKLELLAFAVALAIILALKFIVNPQVSFAVFQKSLPVPILSSFASKAWIFLFAGAVIGAGSLMPGISASFILIYLGIYGSLLDALSNRELVPLLLTGLGSLLAIALLSRLMNWLYLHFHGIVSFAVLGATLGSLILVFPGIPEGSHLVLYSALALGSFLASLFVSSRS